MSERTSFPLYLAAVAIVSYAGLYVGVWISPHLGTCGRVGMTVAITAGIAATIAAWVLLPDSKDGTDA